MTSCSNWPNRPGPWRATGWAIHPAALKIWQGAARRAKAGTIKAKCEAEAADIATNDLLRPAVAKPLLEAAVLHLGAIKNGPIAAAVQRVWGDYYAAVGDGKAAAKAYAQAEQYLGRTRNYTEQTAWRGAHSRSTEEFVKAGQFDRAAAEIHAWQNEFPTEKLDGYLTLLFARYWAGRKQYPQAIAQAEQLQSVNPDSPYVDQLLWLAAECQQQLGRSDRAAATLHSLLKDYPGSPLTPRAQAALQRLEK